MPLRPAGNDPVQQKKIIDEVLLIAHNQQIIIDQPSVMVDYTFIADDRMRKDPQIILNEDFKGKKLNSKLVWLNPPKVWKLRK